MDLTTSAVGRPLRVAVALSGGGTTLQNLLMCRLNGSLPIEIPLVVSSNPKAYGCERARLHNIPLEIIPRRSFDSVEKFSNAVFSAVRAVDADLLCLAGFLQRLIIPTDYHNRVLNIHPALLPAFGGLGMYGHHVHEAVLQHGCKITGCTVHFVDDEYDHGPIIVQRAVEVREDDTPETLAARVFAAECEVYPEAIRLFASGRFRIDGRRVSRT